MATLKIPLHGNGIVTREAIIKAKRPMVAKFARAITEAIHNIKADKETTKAISASTPNLPTRRDSNKPIKTILQYFWMYLMPIRLA